MGLGGLLLVWGICIAVYGVVVAISATPTTRRKATLANSSRRMRKEDKPGYSRGFVLFSVTFWKKGS